MKKILITGGSGFIGRNLREDLSGDFEVAAPDSHELDLLEEDAVVSYLKKYSFDAVIHCATHNATKVSTKDLSRVFYNNVRMFFTLARCNDLYGRMFYFGSGAEYDSRFYLPKMKEEYFDTHVPVDDYGFSKYLMAKYIKATPNIFDLRIFGCFGKYEDWKIRFISNALCKAMYDLPITMRQNVFFDYLYVGDLAPIIKRFITAKTLTHQQYNVCTGATIDLVTLAKKAKKISKKSVDITIAADGLKPEYSGDNTRLLKEFPDIKSTPIDKSIAELYAWYEEHKDEIDKQFLLTNK